MQPKLALKPGILTRFRQSAEERRRFSRVKVTLLGRYMLSDRHEFPCQTSNISPGDAALLAPRLGEIGERVVVYLDQIGRIEGRITRKLENGFALTFTTPVIKREKARRPIDLAGQPRRARHA